LEPDEVVLSQLAYPSDTRLTAITYLPIDSLLFEGAQAGASAIEEEAEAVEELVDDKDDLFQDKPAPRQPTQLRDYSDEDDDGVVQEVYVRLR
jgi:hypothetical protein